MEDKIKQGEALFSEGKFEEAEKCFLDLLNSDPKNAEILNNLGVICYSRNNMAAAEKYFLEAIENKKDYLHPLLNLADLYQNEKRWKDIAVQLEKYISIDNSEPDIFKRLGIVYSELGLPCEAKMALAKSIKLEQDRNRGKKRKPSNCDKDFIRRDFKAAFAEINITPYISENKPVFLQGMAGAPRKATGFETPLMMQLFLLEDNQSTKILFVSADLFGFGPEIVEPVRILAQQWGIESRGLVLNASHTHYSPGTISHMSNSMGPFYSGYAKQIVDAIAQQLPSLNQNLEVCEILSGNLNAQIGVNRRLKQNGNIIFAPNPDGYYEDHTPFLLIHLLEQDKRIILVNHGCHPTGLGEETAVSADYPAYMRDALTSSGLVSGVMFLQGGAGSTKEAIMEKAPVRFCDSSSGARKNGNDLAKQIIEEMGKNLKHLTGPISCITKNISIPLKSLPGTAVIEQIVNNPKEPSIVREWANHILDSFPMGKYPKSLPLEIQVISLGKKVSFISFPAEPVAELAKEIIMLNGNPNGTFILGYTNGLVGYLPNDEIIRQGGYEAGLAHFYYLLPSAPDVGTEYSIVNGVKECFNELEGKSQKKSNEFQTRSPYSELQVYFIVLTGGEDRCRLKYIEGIQEILTVKTKKKTTVIGKGILHPYVMEKVGLSRDARIEDTDRFFELADLFLSREINVIASLNTSDAEDVDCLYSIINKYGKHRQILFINLNENNEEKSIKSKIVEPYISPYKVSIHDGLNQISSKLGNNVSQLDDVHKRNSDTHTFNPMISISECPDPLPPIFIIGSPRSGTTLLYQLMLNNFDLAYFSNFIAEQVEHPVAAALLQKSFREDGIESDYTSENGQTRGEFGPSEFGEFWYRWFPRFPDIYVQADVLPKKILNEIHREIMGISSIYNAPMLIKNTFNSMRIAPLIEAFPQGTFIVCRRDPQYIAQSLLKGRIDLFGNKNTWWSLPPKEYNQIKEHYGWEQVAEQVHYIYKSILQDQNRYGSERFFQVDYAEICRNPNRILAGISDFLRSRGICLKEKKTEIPKSFNASESISINETDFRLIEDKLIELGDVQTNSIKNSYTLEEIEKYIDDSPQGSIFCRPWWLEAVAPGQWDYLAEFKNNKISAMMPVVWQIKNSQRIIGHPPLTQTLGVLLPEFNCKYVKMLSRQTELIKKLIDKLPDYTFFHQNFNYNFTNWLPFLWKGFSQTTRYTYVIQDLSDLDIIWKGLRENIKTDIRKAEKKLRVLNEPDIDIFLNLNELTFKRQGQSPPYTREFVKRLDNILKEHDARKMFFALDEEDRIHAATYIIWDKKSAYYLMSGADPELRNSGATSLLIWESIKFSSTVTKKFDFEGSIMEPIERFFRAFGGKQMPYFQIMMKK